jgi:cysteine desulfurase
MSELGGLVYADNNATTLAPDKVRETVNAWFNKGNPSSSHKYAQQCKDLISKAKSYIAEICDFSLDDFSVIFTSGASESNNSIIRTCVESYHKSTEKLPHVILSTIEHKTSLECVKVLSNLNQCEYTLVQIRSDGCIHAEDIETYIQDNTCLLSVMHANNETGLLNDIASIGKIAHRHKIPFHTDAVQSFPKMPLNPNENHVDAFSISFHKLHGPPGLGLLVIRNSFMRGYKLNPLICGSQNDGHRGGTENIPYIAGALEAMKYTFKKRNSKNAALLKYKKKFLEFLSNTGLSNYQIQQLIADKYRQSDFINLCVMSQVYFYLVQ